MEKKTALNSRQETLLSKSISYADSGLEERSVLAWGLCGEANMVPTTRI